MKQTKILFIVAIFAGLLSLTPEKYSDWVLRVAQ